MLEKAKRIASTLGDCKEVGTLYPVDLRPDDKEYLAYIEANFPDQQEKWEKINEFLLTVSGKSSMTELMECATDEDVIRETREGIHILLDSLGEDEDEEGRKENAEKYCRMADEMIVKIIKKLFPGYAGDMGIREEVKTSDLGELLLLGYAHSNQSEEADEEEKQRVRYEAKRKFELVRLISIVSTALDKKKGTQEFFLKQMKNRVFVPNENKGNTWIVSTHDKDDNYVCTNCELRDEQPKSLDDNQVVESLYLRTCEVDTPDGGTRKIKFSYNSRIKDVEALVLKWLRKPDRKLEDLLSDAYGARMIFENDQDLADFKATLVRKMSNPDPKTGEVFNVEMRKKKNGVGDNGSNKPAILCDKFSLVVDDKDVEMQLFTKEQYANYQTHRPNSWVEYMIHRFFNHSLSETLFPSAIFKDLDRKKIAEFMSSQAFKDFWDRRRQLPEGSNEVAEETRVKIKEVERKSTVVQTAESEKVLTPPTF